MNIKSFSLINSLHNDYSGKSKDELIELLNKKRAQLIYLETAKTSSPATNLGWGATMGLTTYNIHDKYMIKQYLNEIKSYFDSNFTDPIKSYDAELISPLAAALSFVVGVTSAATIHAVNKLVVKKTKDKLIKEIQELELKIYGKIKTKLKNLNYD